jgi:hypothetical protein
VTVDRLSSPPLHSNTSSSFSATYSPPINAISSSSSYSFNTSADPDSVPTTINSTTINNNKTNLNISNTSSTDQPKNTVVLTTVVISEMKLALLDILLALLESVYSLLRIFFNNFSYLVSF